MKCLSEYWESNCLCKYVQKKNIYRFITYIWPNYFFTNLDFPEIRGPISLTQLPLQRNRLSEVASKFDQIHVLKKSSSHRGVNPLDSHPSAAHPVSNVYLGLSCPGCNRHRQDHYIFSRGSQPKPSFASGILGGGTTQCLPSKRFENNYPPMSVDDDGLQQIMKRDGVYVIQVFGPDICPSRRVWLELPALLPVRMCVTGQLHLN